MSRDKNADNDWIIINFQRETNIRKGLIRNKYDLITNYVNAIIYNNAVIRGCPYFMLQVRQGISKIRIE